MVWIWIWIWFAASINILLVQKSKKWKKEEKNTKLRKTIATFVGSGKFYRGKACTVVWNLNAHCKNPWAGVRTF